MMDSQLITAFKVIPLYWVFEYLINDAFIFKGYGYIDLYTFKCGRKYIILILFKNAFINLKLVFMLTMV